MLRLGRSRGAIIDGTTYVLVVAVACITLACTGDSAAPKPKQRPKGVPASAVWQSAEWWGYYFDCDAQRNEFNNCAIYRIDGSVVVRGRYRLATYNRAATRSELNYEFFDGEVIYLSNNKRLSPLDKKPGGEALKEQEAAPARGKEP